MSCAHSIDRRAGCNGTRRRPERAGRSRREALRRPDGHAGERLSRSATGRIEPAAFVGPHALAARPTLRHFSPGGAGVQPRQKSACWTCLAERMKRNREVKALLDRRQARCVAVSPLARDTFGQSAIQLAAVEIAKAIATDFRTDLSDHIISLDLLGSTIVKHYVAARPQCPSLRPQGAARPRPRAGAGRAWRRRQAGHDERRIPDRFAAGHGCALPQAREPAHRRGLASRADRSRPALEHQLLCHAQFLRPPRDGRRAQGRTERRQLRQGQHCRAGRSQRAHGGDRALFRDFSGRRDQSDAAVHGFPARRRHSSERRPAVQRRAVPARSGRRRPARTRCRRCRPRSIDRPRSNGRRSGPCATNASNIFRPACCISSTGAPPATGPRGFQRLRGRQHARGSNRPGIPRAGGTGCIRNLVVQSIAAGGSGPRPVRRSLHP